jgi:hypothetical protein
MLRVQRFARWSFTLALSAFLISHTSQASADSFGSWGSSGGSSGGSWGGRPGLFGSGSRGGPVRNLLGRVHDRFHSGLGSRGGSSGGTGEQRRIVGRSSGGYVCQSGSAAAVPGVRPVEVWFRWIVRIHASSHSGYGNWASPNRVMQDQSHRFPYYLDGAQPAEPDYAVPEPGVPDDNETFWQL